MFIPLDIPADTAKNLEPGMTRAKKNADTKRGSAKNKPSRSQLGLFLAEPPFVSAFVAPLSCPDLGFFVVSAGISRGIIMSPAVLKI